MDNFVYGTISVKAVLEEEKRTARMLWVNPKKRSRDIAYLIALCKKKRIPVEFQNPETMNAKASGNGGVILFCETRSLPALKPEHLEKGLCVYISGVEDPYNMGSICRTLYAAGARLLILHERDWSSALSTLMRSSAGAWERLEIATIENDTTLIECALMADRPIYCAARDDSASSLADTILPENCLLAIGGAMRGLSSEILKASSHHLFIPYGRHFHNALDTASAASVFAFAWTFAHPDQA